MWAGQGALILFAGLFDMLDGQVARIGNMSSRFGALYDSVLDRYSEMFMFLGICYYLVAHHYFLSSLFAFIALIGSMMVSYTRARSEGLGIENKGGLMQRPERVVLTAVSAIACGVTASVIGGDYKLSVPGIPFHVFETMSVFTIPITVMAVLTNVTAIKRLMDAKKALDNKVRMRSCLLLVLGICLSVFIPCIAQQGFPVPDRPMPCNCFTCSGLPILNTIVYELNYKDGDTG
jgi:CDP-diacylglycerol--glycerol-3-phosphate 3-phosphatidyltransferase